MGCFDLTTILVCLCVILTTFLIFILFQNKKLFKQLQSISNLTNRDKLSSYELERLEREEEFDKRIKGLKEEVIKQSEIIRRGVQADELHPLVHNLPHGVIESKYDLSDYEEVAE